MYTLMHVMRSDALHILAEVHAGGWRRLPVTRSRMEVAAVIKFIRGSLNVWREVPLVIKLLMLQESLLNQDQNAKHKSVE